MAPSDGLSSSPAPKGGSLEEELAYYKAQYEQLEAELQDFQASSRELEAELEKDIETAEKRERKLQEKADGLGFEVDEWKVSHVLNTVYSIFLFVIADLSRRQSTSNPRPKQTTLKTLYKKRSPPFETRTGHSN
jgi:hypothetical protein